MYFDVMITGFGGQGIMLMGNLLAYAAIIEGRNVTYMPAYGVEMRGGTAHCTVVISDEEIGSPIVDRPMAIVTMNQPSLDKFQERVQKDGLLLVNSSLCNPQTIIRNDIKILKSPFNDIAGRIGSERTANMVALGALVEMTGAVALEHVEASLVEMLNSSNQELVAMNIKSLKTGAEIARKDSRGNRF